MTNQPFAQGKLKVSNIHEISYWQWGNPAGIPIVHIHGGPGSKSKTKNLNLYDLSVFRVIFFDQRGCGQSTPQGDIRENTIQNLVEDMEALRQQLGVDRWILSGGSWGTTVALLYAQQYAQYVSAIFLRGVFLARQNDYTWLSTPSGAARTYPDQWQFRQEALAKLNIGSENLLPGNLSQVLLDKLNNSHDPLEIYQVLTVVFWEDGLSKLTTASSVLVEPEASEIEIDQEEVNSAKIFLHYDINKFFLTENQLVLGLPILKDIPLSILHGRYDMVCPLEQAYLVKQQLPHVVLEIPNYMGHGLDAENERLCRYMLTDLVSKIK